MRSRAQARLRARQQRASRWPESLATSAPTAPQRCKGPFFASTPKSPMTRRVRDHVFQAHLLVTARPVAARQVIDGRVIVQSATPATREAFRVALLSAPHSGQA